MAEINTGIVKASLINALNVSESLKHWQDNNEFNKRVGLIYKHDRNAERLYEICDYEEWIKIASETKFAYNMLNSIDWTLEKNQEVLQKCLTKKKEDDKIESIFQKAYYEDSQDQANRMIKGHYGSDSDKYYKKESKFQKADRMYYEAA